jgi:hypothetical protein
MRIGGRVIMVAVVLTVALAAKTALFGYLQSAGPLPTMTLGKPLVAFPRDFPQWAGRDLPITDPRTLIGDQRLSRVYFNREHKQQFRLWMVYSASGEDRGHHPEVCMRAAGIPEDPQGRAELSAAGDPQPIQQYRFGRTSDGEGLLGFYWYYTLFPPRNEDISPLQRGYQRCQRRPSSLTIEVFTPAEACEDVGDAQDFVRSVDHAIRAFLPPGAVRGSARLPVLLVNDSEVQPR